MIGKKLLILSLFLMLLGTVLSTALDLGVVNVSAVPLSPYIMIIPEQTVNSTITPGMNYTIAIYTDYGGSDIWQWQFELTFDPYVLEGLEVRNGDLITKAKNSSATFIAGAFDNIEGKLDVTVGFFKFPPTPIQTSTGPGTCAYVTFKVVGTGGSEVPPTPNIVLGDTTWLIIYEPPATFPKLILASEPEGKTEPPYGSDHIGHGYFDNIPNVHDLAVSKLVTPTTAIPGDLVPISVTVRNEGNFTENSDVTVYANTTFIGSQTVNLARAAKATLAFDWNTTDVVGGIYIINATAWLSEDIDLGDNAKTTQIEIKSVHDVAITSLEVSAEVIAEDVVPINITVRNEGNVEENVTLTVSYKQNAPGDPPPVVINSTTFIIAERPTSNIILVSWNTTGLEPSFWYTINATITIDQDEEPSDNTMAKTIFLRLGHDVAITALSTTPTVVFVGETMTIIATVKNVGGFNETLVEVKVTYDSNVIGSQQVLSLPVGNSTILSFTWNTTGVVPSRYKIRAEALLDTDANPTNDFKEWQVFVETPAGHVAGTVRDASTGNPIEGVQITANGHSDTTDANGYYNITSIPVGAYTITASKDGYHIYSEVDINVVVRQTTNLNFTLIPLPTTGHISGTVTDASTGNPIEGANVAAEGHFDITDANGYYNITNVLAGTYTVAASIDGYENSSSTNVVVTAGQTIIVDFELTPKQTSDMLPYLVIAVVIIIAAAGIAVLLRKMRKTK